VSDKIFIAQALCSQRHCLMACCAKLPEDQAYVAAEGLAEILDERIAKGEIKPVCALCGEPRAAWTFEAKASIFATLEEALPVVRAIESRNRLTAMLMRLTGQTAEQWRAEFAAADRKAEAAKYN
jgi:hypothetical protein